MIEYESNKKTPRAQTASKKIRSNIFPRSTSNLKARL